MMSEQPKQENTSNKIRNTANRRTFLQAASAAGIAGLAGCSADASGDGFRVGLNVPLSGGTSLIGRGMENAIQIAVDDINNSGGIGGTESEINLIVADNEDDPQTGVERTNQLINEDDVEIIIGPVSSAVRNSMTPICEQNEVPLVYPTNYEGPAAPDYCSEYLFKTSHVPSQLIEPTIPWVMDEYGTDFYLLGSDYLWPQEMNSAITEVVEANGGSILNEQYVSLGTTDLSSVILDIEQTDPDVLMTQVVGPTPGALQAQLSNNDLRGDGLTEIGLGHSEPTISGVSDEDLEGLLYLTNHHTNLETERNQELMSRYYDRYGEDEVIGAIGIWAYETMRMVDAALEGVSEATGETVRESLPGTSIETVSGELTMAHDHQAEQSIVAAEMDSEGEYRTIKDDFEPNMPPETCGL